MYAHVIENGVVVNTIVVNSLDALPNIIDASLGGVKGDLWNGEFFSKPSVPKIVPEAISMRQCRLQLLADGILDTVNTLINASGIPSYVVEWEYAQEVRRDHLMLIALQPALGLTDDQLDDMFISASQII